MKDVKDKVAVVTGAASGIRRFARCKTPAPTYLRCAPMCRKPEQVDELVRQTLKKYGAVHVLCNNAGIATGVGGGASWKSSLNDWHWILGVNLMGVVHGIRSFLPVMIEQDTEAHIVNTASLAGLIPSSALYGTTKFAVVGLSESTYLELQRGGHKPKMSVLCPGFVDTNIIDSERNRPAEFTDQTSRQAPPDEAFRKWFSELLKNSLSPREVGKHVLAAIREERFYILTHPEWNALIEQRMKDILSGNNPTQRPLPGSEMRMQSAPQAN